MGYQVYQDDAARDIGVERWAGYGVPAVCDHPGCTASIDRGLGYRCARCGLSFCSDHLWIGGTPRDPQMCERCCDDEEPFEPKPDTPEWEAWMLSDESWQRWRDENPAKVAEMRNRSTSQRCRECSEGKHGACNGTALVDEGLDVLEVDCICGSPDHGGDA